MVDPSSPETQTAGKVSEGSQTVYLRRLTRHQRLPTTSSATLPNATAAASPIAVRKRQWQGDVSLSHTLQQTEPDVKERITTVARPDSS